MVDSDKVRELFKKYDFNKNGVLEKEEFIKVFVKLLSSIGKDMPEKRHIQIAEEGLEKFDLNSNGMIEFDEFERVISFFVEEKGYQL